MVGGDSKHGRSFLTTHAVLHRRAPPVWMRWWPNACALPTASGTARKPWSVCTPCSRSWLNGLTAHRPPPRPPPRPRPPPPTYHRGRGRRTSNLRLEVHFARRLIARDGPEYDQLFDKLKSNQVSWRQELDLGDLTVRQVEALDHEFVSLRFPVGEVAKRIGELRSEAKQKHGKGSGVELTLKLKANTLFGVISSQHHPTNNVVAGNFITAHARAEAYGMMMSLNALQVVTDGCWYRRDRIPACTFRECLDRMPDYPLRHADEKSGVPFLDPSLIPDDDIEFSGWLVDHLCWFFEVNREEHRRFFATHRFEHKRTGKTDSAAFDAMCCDGAGNYVKMTGDRDAGWHPQESAIRGYRAESKAVLIPWLIHVYQSDRMTELPPITEDVNLLKLEPAKGKARRSLKHMSRKAVRLPLGMSMTSLHSYQIFRPSGFVFRTQKQLRAVQRQLDRLRADTGCGLDLLVLKQNHAGRKHGSLSKVAAELYEYLRAGGKDLKKKFHLGSRSSRQLQAVVSARVEAIKSRRTEIEEQIFRAIAVEPERPPVTGIVVTRENTRLLD